MSHNSTGGSATDRLLTLPPCATGMVDTSMNLSDCPCLSVVIPAYNEEVTLASVVEKVLAVPHLREIVVVNDHSKDRTGEVAEQLAGRYSQVKVLHHAENK